MSETKSSELLALSDELSRPLNARLKQLEDQIARYAARIAKERIRTKDKQQPSRSDTDAVVLEDLSQAIAEALGQRESTACKSGLDKFFEWFPPFTCLSFVLCVAFGTLGLVAMRNGSEPSKDMARGFLDVAKIFAGAIVGSTASTVLKAAKSVKGGS